jgi:hypothetical protein
MKALEFTVAILFGFGCGFLRQFLEYVVQAGRKLEHLSFLSAGVVCTATTLGLIDYFKITNIETIPFP